MASKLHWKDRILDFVIFAVIGLLFYQGYHRASGGYFNPGAKLGIEYPLLLLCAFVTIFYPFRIHTRAVWILLAPLSLFAAPLFGAHAFHRLRFAPGLEQQFKVLEIQVYALLFIAFCIAWLIPGAFGWQLTRPGVKRLGRNADLRELFTMTAIVAVMLILFRDAFDLEELSTGTKGITMRLLTWFAFKQFALFGICIWLGLTFHWSICLMVTSFAVGVQSYFDWRALSNVQLAGTIRRSYWDVFESRVWNVGVLLLVVMAIRIAGYRIARGRAAWAPRNPTH